MYFIREPQTSQLLDRKVVAIQSHRADLILRTAPTPPPPSIIQPLTLLFTKPTLFLSSLTNAFSTALLYLFAVAFPLIYTHYGWSRQKTTLTFLFIALGLLLSTIPQIHTHHKIRNHRLSNRRPTRSTHLFNLAIGAPALAIALWWFAWTIPTAKTNPIAWPASAISLILLGCGINVHSTALPRYVLDCPRKSARDDVAASASFTALLVTKALLCAVFPLFTQQMFEGLGYNIAGSVIAAIATAFCLFSFILIRFGEKWSGGGGGVAGSMDGDGEEEVKMEEKRSKPRKTVRWGDEMDSSSSNGSSDGSSEQTGSDSHVSESESETGSSELSRTETVTVIETETETETKTETEAETNEDPTTSTLPAISRSETQISTRDFANVATTETQHHTEDEKHEKEKHEKEDDDEKENTNLENSLSAPLSKSSTQNTSGSSSKLTDAASDKSSTLARTETKISNTNTSNSSSAARSKNEKEKHKKNKKTKKDKKADTKTPSDIDNGPTGGMWGLDLERLAVLPYF